MTVLAGIPANVAAIACDFDRTLVWEDNIVRPRTRTAIARLQTSGIPVVIATGRMYRSIRPYVSDLGLDHPVICYQGAVVADPVTDEFLLHEPIPLDLAREAITAVEAHDFPLNCYVDDVLYVGDPSPESERYAGFQQLTIHPVGNLLEWLKSPPTKLVAIGDPDLVDELEIAMKAHFGDRLFISKSLPYFLEFASPNVSKGSGLAFVAKQLGFELEKTIAFGDGENDVELLEVAGYAIAVENAHPRVQELADFVCGPAYEEGVAAVLESLLAGTR